MDPEVKVIIAEHNLLVRNIFCDDFDAQSQKADESLSYFSYNNQLSNCCKRSFVSLKQGDQRTYIEYKKQKLNNN